MECDFCESRAIVNYQKTWVKFDIARSDRYKFDFDFNGLDIEDISFNENYHFCRKHSEQWLDKEDVNVMIVEK